MKSFEFNQSKNISTERSVGEIVNGEMITNEVFGDAADITRLALKIGDHTKSFVLKDYDQNNGWNTTAQEAALHSVAVWERIKSLKLPTYTTYRLEKEGTSLLMTDLESDEYSALSSNHASPDWYNEEGNIEKRIHIIENFENLIEQIKLCIEKTSSVGIVLEPDAYFILVKELIPGTYEAQVFIGDFEGITIPESDTQPSLADPEDNTMSIEEMRTESSEYGARALEYFVEKYMPEEIAQVYKKIIDLAFNRGD